MALSYFSINYTENRYYYYGITKIIRIYSNIDDKEYEFEINHSDSGPDGYSDAKIDFARNFVQVKL